MRVISGLAAAAAGLFGFGAHLAAPVARPAVRHAPGRRPSKHSRKAAKGACIIGQFSNLCKLMRAARRGLLPVERLQVIKQAQESAARRGDVYMHSHARNWARNVVNESGTIDPAVFTKLAVRS